MNLLDYCIEVVSEADGNLEVLADLLMSAVESDSPIERELVWNLLKQAGMPMYTKQAFLDAAQLALDIVNTGPEAA